MEQEKLVQGWMVCGTDEEAQKPEMYFLDVNNAIAKDLHKSRLRQRDGKQER